MEALIATPTSVHPRFLVAKFTADLRRQEPRNVGVILLHEKGVYARFFGEGMPELDDGPGIDGRRVRSRVFDPETYAQWVEFWRHSVEQYASLEDRSPADAQGVLSWCENALLGSSRQHYGIIKGGEVLVQGLEGKDPSVLLTHLYNVLVEEDEYPPVENIDLKGGVNDILRRAGLQGHPLLQPALAIDVRGNGKRKARFRPDFVFVRNSTYTVLESVPLHATSKKLSQRNVDAVQFMYDRLEAHARDVNKMEADFFSFVDGRTDHYSYDPSEFIETLAGWGHAIDVFHPDDADHKLRALLTDNDKDQSALS